MFLLDHSKHPQYQLKLYSVHCLADGVRIFLTIAFPFKESFKFDIVYDRNFGCLRYVGFRRQVTVLVRFGLPPHSCARFLRVRGHSNVRGIVSCCLKSSE